MKSEFEQIDEDLEKLRQEQQDLEDAQYEQVIALDGPNQGKVEVKVGHLKTGYVQLSKPVSIPEYLGPSDMFVAPIGEKVTTYRVEKLMAQTKYHGNDQVHYYLTTVSGGRSVHSIISNLEAYYNPEK